MAMGVPVVVSRTKIDSFYHTSEQVEFFESENEPALAAAILRLSQDDSRRAELTRNGLQYVREHSWQMKKHEYLDLVDVLSGIVRRTQGEGSVETQRSGQGARAASL